MLNNEKLPNGLNFSYSLMTNHKIIWQAKKYKALMEENGMSFTTSNGI